MQPQRLQAFADVAEINFSVVDSTPSMSPPIIPTKSASDDREYRVFSLKNELQVLLVHDPTSDKVQARVSGRGGLNIIQAAASMAVGVGFHNDPDNIPGLAHLLGLLHL